MAPAIVTSYHWREPTALVQKSSVISLLSEEVNFSSTAVVELYTEMLQHSPLFIIKMNSKRIMAYSL